MTSREKSYVPWQEESGMNKRFCVENRILFSSYNKIDNFIININNMHFIILFKKNSFFVAIGFFKDFYFKMKLKMKFFTKFHQNRRDSIFRSALTFYNIILFDKIYLDILSLRYLIFTFRLELCTSTLMD